MKSFSLFFVVSVFFGMAISASAQSQMFNGVQHSAEGHFGANEIIIPHQDQSNTTQSFWLSYADARAVSAVSNGKHPSRWYFHIFPDSLGVSCDPNCVYSNIHSAGVVLDPFAPIMQYSYGINWSEWNSYTVDSMSIQYLYVRHTTANIVDTLIVTMYTDEQPGDLDTYLFSYSGSGLWEMNFGIIDTLADTLQWKQMLYDYHTNSPSIGVSSNKQVLKIPLTKNDTSWSLIGNKIFSTNAFNVSAGKHVVAAGVQFKPGYSYVLGDTITKTKNDFMLLSYEENDTCNTNFSSCPSYPTYTPGDWNSSFIIRKSERYNFTGNNWDGLYVPTWSFGKAYVLEDHLFSFKVTSMNVGLSENSTPVNGIKLYQNIPNPACNFTLIKYDTESQGTATLEVGDIAGRILLTLDQGSQSAGKHEVVVDLSGLAKGMYFYTLKSNGSSLTRQMIVIN